MAFKIFDTISKKLAIPVFVLFAIGWIVYVAGFGLALSDEALLVTAPSSLPINSNPAYFPFYFTLVGGPFVITLGLVHAALPSSSVIVEAIVGAVVAILTNVYFISTGYTPVYCSILIQRQQQRGRDGGHFADILNLMFAGTIILIVSLSISQLLVIFYRKRTEQQHKSWWVRIVHIAKIIVVEEDTGSEPSKCCITEILGLLSIPTVLCCVIGYGVYARGLYSFIEETYTLGIPIYSNFASWVSLTIPPFAIFTALLQAGSSESGSTSLAILVSILNAFMMSCVGYVVTYTGQIVILFPLIGASGLPEEYKFVFGGGITFLLFWTVLLVLSRFYTISTDSMQTGNTSSSTTAGLGPSDQRQPTHLYVTAPFLTPASPFTAHSELKEPPSYDEASTTPL